MATLLLFQPPTVDPETELLTIEGARMLRDMETAVLNAFQEQEAERAEAARQSEYDADARRRELAREKVRREREEAEISGKLGPDAELFLTGRLKPGIKEAHDFTPKVRVPIVQGLFFQDTLAWVAGQSGTFKSFVTADLAFRYGTEDMDYHGMRMTHGRALLVIAEGAAGYADRKTAWEKEHGREVKNVSIYPGALQLGDVQKEMPALLAYLRQEKESGRGFTLIVFDTQAMCTVGIDENKSEINLVINVLHRIRQETGACVLTVHHFGKTASAGMRGSSMLYAAADTVCIVKSKDDALDVILSTSQADEGKQKDAPTQKDFLALDLKVHDVGEDYFGDPVTSLVPVQTVGGSTDVHADSREAPSKLPSVTEKQLFWLRVIGTFSHNGAKPTQILERLDDLDEYEIVPPAGMQWGRQTPRNRMENLQQKGLVELRSDGVWVISPTGVARVAQSMIDRHERPFRKQGSDLGSEPNFLPGSEPSGT